VSVVCVCVYGFVLKQLHLFVSVQGHSKAKNILLNQSHFLQSEPISSATVEKIKFICWCGLLYTLHLHIPCANSLVNYHC